MIEYGHMIDEETMKYAVSKDIWFTSQYLVFTIDNRALARHRKPSSARSQECGELFRTPRNTTRS